ncbi:MAG TPA: histidine phosphatase family protein [Kiritimatiellia bacterium]|nr:histidine phosphatase family protein [Kiritimatiellia bacterium]
MKRICALLVVWTVGIACARAQIDVYYVRHAEAGHNVTTAFKASGIPTNEWPAYVGNQNALTPAGEAQIAALTEGLKEQRFDLIAVSPIWRTRQTILPYVQASGQTAELWPELAETHAFELTPEALAAPVAADLIEGRQVIRLPPEEEAWFVVGAPGTAPRLFSVTNAAEAVAVARRVEEKLRERFAGRPGRVLLVGHGNSSLTLLRHLRREPGLRERHLGNVQFWNGVLESDGSFRMRDYNRPADKIFGETSSQ